MDPVIGALWNVEVGKRLMVLPPGRRVPVVSVRGTTRANWIREPTIAGAYPKLELQVTNNESGGPVFRNYGHEDDPSAIDADVIGATKTEPKAWYRIFYIDVITRNSAIAPFQYLTLPDAKKWQNKRQQPRSQVMALLQRFTNEVGWKTV